MTLKEFLETGRYVYPKDDKTLWGVTTGDKYIVVAPAWDNGRFHVGHRLEDPMCECGPTVQWNEGAIKFIKPIIVHNFKHELTKNR